MTYEKLTEAVLRHNVEMLELMEELPRTFEAYDKLVEALLRHRAEMLELMEVLIIELDRGDPASARQSREANSRGL